MFGSPAYQVVLLKAKANHEFWTTFEIIRDTSREYLHVAEELAADGGTV